jgi:hypothetical protein
LAFGGEASEVEFGDEDRPLAGPVLGVFAPAAVGGQPSGRPHRVWDNLGVDMENVADGAIWPGPETIVGAETDQRIGLAAIAAPGIENLAGLSLRPAN